MILTEGIAELFSVGICSNKHILDLRNYVNDTFIFEFFKARKYPFYFHALKWVAYLVNEQPPLLKTLLSSLQNNDTERFYVTLDNFIDNASNREAFVNWSHQQVDICNNYLSIFPAGHQPPLIYLEGIKPYVSQIQMAKESLVNSTYLRAKRDLQLCLDDLCLDENTIESTSPSEAKRIVTKEFWQQVEIGGFLQLNAFLSGITSSVLDDISLSYKDNFPSLTTYTYYGFKPLFFAGMNASLNRIWFDQTMLEAEERLARFFAGFIMNFLGVLVGQPLTKTLAEKIPNKILCFFVQMLTWTVLWNPDLFLSEDSLLLPALFLQLTQGLCFKVGEEVYQLGKNICSPSRSSFWHKKEKLAIENNLNDEKISVNKVQFGKVSQ